MSEEKTTKYDKLKDLCDHLVDTIGNSSDEKHGRIIDTAFDIFKEHEGKYYKDLEPAIQQSKNEISEADEHAAIEVVGKLNSYLKYREQDIAGRVEDFGDLYEVFVYFLDREPVFAKE